MPDALTRSSIVAPQLRSMEPPQVAVPSVETEANDNVTPQQNEARLFELPTSIWGMMIACYGVFLIALLGATGGVHTAFAIAVCAVYVAMFFGTARAMLRQSPAQPRSPIDRPRTYLQTAFGPLARSEVYGQVLIVPLGVAFFGVSVAIVRAVLT